MNFTGSGTMGLSSPATSRVFVRSVTGSPMVDAVRNCMGRFEWESWVAPDSTVVIKPNVCTAVPDIAVGADTNPEVVRAVCEVLQTRTRRIYIGESRHLRQTPWEAFKAAGYVEMARELGVELINFSEGPFTLMDCPPAGRIKLPSLLLEADAYINIPVLKTHALTYFTGALKNQWGCVPDHFDRLRHHRKIGPMLCSLQRILHARLVIMDGTFGMEGRGPVAGRVRRLDMLLASPDPVALDSTAMRLVGLDPRRARHVTLAAEEGIGHFEESQIEVEGDCERCRVQFQPPPRDVANTAMFYLSSQDWFTKHILGNDRIYHPIRDAVKFLRRTGLLGG
jgi:uncharacterized protein (DUF362 family)